MSDTKGTNRSGGMNIDSKLVRELAELLAETGLTEIEVEDGEREEHGDDDAGGARQADPADERGVGEQQRQQTEHHGA